MSDIAADELSFFLSYLAELSKRNVNIRTPSLFPDITAQKVGRPVLFVENTDRISPRLDL